MADAIEEWLDELAGRRPGDAMTTTLRRHLLQQPQNDDIAFQKLLARLDAEDLLIEPGLSRRRKWSASLAAVASILLLATVMLPTALKKEPPLSQAGYQAPSEMARQKPAAPVETFASDAMQEHTGRAMSARRLESQNKMRGDAAGRLPARSLCRHQLSSKQAKLQISALSLSETQQFYAELAGVEGLKFVYDSALRETRIYFTTEAQRQSFKLMLMDFAGGYCDLSGVNVLHLSLPIGEVQ